MNKSVFCFILCVFIGHPLRASGKVNIDVNGIQINQQDLQAYIVVADGRSYIAISKVPVIGISFQLLYPITTMLNWLFAIPTGTGLNGFQITGMMKICSSYNGTELNAIF